MAFYSRGPRARRRQGDSAAEWSPLWLRFHDSQKEAGFLRAQKPFLLRRVQVVAAMGIVMDISGILMGAVEYRPWDSEMPITDFQREVSFITISIAVALLPVLSVFLAAMCFKRLTDRVGSLVIEVATILVAVLVMVVGVIGSAGNITALKGAPVSDALPYPSDSRTLLRIDGVVTAAHLGLPIRWFVMLPLEVASILLYVFVIVIGGSEPKPHLNLAYLTGLVILSALGKRHAELGDRQAFMKLIREKRLRCQAEFQLSQVGGDAEVQAQALQPGLGATNFRAEVESAPTSKSGTAFSPGDKNLSVAAKMARIAEIGRAEHWLIGSKSIKLLPDRVLGRGGFGFVIKAVMSGIIVAVKLPRTQLENSEMPRFRDMCNELRVLRHLRHPNLVSFYGAIIDPLGRKLALVLEYVQGVLLDAFIRKGQRGDEEVRTPASTMERFQILLGTCSALLHMHTVKPCIVHSDLKAPNIMVEMLCSEVRPKLLDFGLARVVAGGEKKARGGTLSWMAPEVITDKAPAMPSMDVYSFGHMINFVLTGAKPPRLTGPQLRSKQPAPPPLPQGSLLEPVCGPLARDCLMLEATARPSMGEVYHRLLDLPEYVQLPGVSPGFLERLRILGQRLESANFCAAGSSANLHSNQGQQDGEVGEELAPSDIGMHLPSLPPVAASDEAAADPPDRTPPQSTLWKPCPHLPTTKENSMLHALLKLVATWNPERRKPPCCELHASMKVVQHLCSLLADTDCTKSALPRPRAHCPECGLLTHELGLCDFCGVLVRAHAGLESL